MVIGITSPLSIWVNIYTYNVNLNMNSSILKYCKSIISCFFPMLQVRQKEPSVKTLRSPLCAKFWVHCVSRGGTQRRDLPLQQIEEMKIFWMFHFLKWESKPQPYVTFTVTRLCSWPKNRFFPTLLFSLIEKSSSSCQRKPRNRIFSASQLYCYY